MSLIFPRQKIFNKYLSEYSTLPQYKKILNGLIKFKDMYQDVATLPYPGKAMAKEERAAKRAEIYMLRRDIISTRDDIYGKKLVVTSRGHKIFYNDYPLAKLRKKRWDGNWTVIMYDFPETLRAERKNLRRNLMNLGFGSPQLSILISPLPIDEDMQKYIEGRGVKKYVWTLKAKRILGMDNIEVAKIAWPGIQEIFELYNILLNSLPKIKKRKNNTQLLKIWKAYFLAVNTADPHLPYDLLDDDWPAEDCEEAFIRLGFGGILKILLRKFK